ncbi:hypothetical protein [Streptomyces boluensis]|uniref:Uncharacterized protein n=1 Tax=Streptomyces boluensis TaxID=1775135 RepID=A0A964UM43_9ACTN|nr:hypothetical protein [Streptomyces boluensis]NBE51738.1 hypothetical protein [Streptomyces boluensis]
MSEFLEYEQNWVDTLEELKSCPEIHTTHDIRGDLKLRFGDADRVFKRIANLSGVTLPDAWKPYYLRFAGIGSCWSFGGDSPGHFGGEFHVTNLFETTLTPSPAEAWSGIPGLSEEFLEELHPFDGTPTTGVGHLALLRLTKGASDAEVWFHASPYEPHRMDLDYPTYLETLRITKGAFCWQYLFVDPAEVDLSSEEFASAAGLLTRMLETFPRVFPEHDYSDLQARLEARL